MPQPCAIAWRKRLESLTHPKMPLCALIMASWCVAPALSL
jgi:hypothetical protein